MMRKVVLVGDPPAGGRVLPYDGPMVDFFGHRPALIGGRAYCEGCNSVGIIAKAGGPRRPLFIFGDSAGGGRGGVPLPGAAAVAFRFAAVGGI